MKWITHQVGAGLCAITLGMSLAATATVVVGAVIPDMIDQRLSKMANKKRRQKIFNQIHRGSSHWFGWWLLLFMGLLWLPADVMLKETASGLALGALSHIGLDMLTPRGVPFFPARPLVHLSLPLCSTGKISEYIFLACLVLAAAIFSYPELVAIIHKLAAH